jgi:hypothetical protein
MMHFKVVSAIAGRAGRKPAEVIKTNLIPFARSSLKFIFKAVKHSLSSSL